MIHLSGPLGAGKTTLVRGLLRGLGVRDRVKSPTFSLVEPYTISSLYLYHFDFYRFTHPMEWEAAGLGDYFDGRSICLIEWAEKATGLPPADLRVTFEIVGGARAVTLHADSPAGRECLPAESA
jgi:tRNA threonylcarbamoyladenosine biosynthesis protein TsaE